MGAEQSSQQGRRAPPVGRQRSAGTPTSPDAGSPSWGAAVASRSFEAGLSRHESVASDVDSSLDVPYVSYTVNRPIGGDSPKRRAPAAAQQRSSYSRLARLSSRARAQDSRLKESAHNTMVTVRERDDGDGGGGGGELDPELVRLARIPSFLPIMRASLSGSDSRDPDILERLDYRGLLSMAERYQAFLRANALAVSTQQAEITRSVREVDRSVSGITQALGDRQKAFAHHHAKFKQVHEVSKCLAKCQLLLNENIEQLEVLNNMLPPDDRLEPFVWTTG